MEGLRIEHPCDGAALLTLTQPDQLNARGDELLLRVLADTFAELAADASVRAVVVTAAVETARVFASMPPRAVKTTKANLYKSMELDLVGEVLEQEVRAQAVALHGSEFPDRFPGAERPGEGVGMPTLREGARGCAAARPAQVAAHANMNINRVDS